MKSLDLNKLDFLEIVLTGDDSEIVGCYCCDLLSVVMARGKNDHVFVTVMGNMNAVAVSSLCEMPAIVVAEGMQVDDDMVTKAKTAGISIYKTDLDIFTAACKIKAAIDED